ncbi:MAG TPA: LLM class flavin-dependent oxidoreductase [Beijerinckiaceae bacterium]|jgi:alkanesulfonate monooxygenase SsuD/methylene tetrahydromethanopterin reductase-like flavin-dependent oxidoreductase (luciferase family)
MEAWHFTEMPYPHLPSLDDIPSIRVTIPSKHFDPKVGADLYNRYLDEHVIADELGLHIMLNEHHQTATCLNAAAPLMASILARQTTKARICILGNPIANRGDPIRIAEEMAIIDCLSRGRLDCGFVRGVPYEIFAANTNPTQTVERLWEGVDLVVKAWTSHEGPFNFEGRFWHKRAVNVWPRPYQTPHPQVWITGSSDKEGIKKVADRGYVFATFLQPHDKVREMFDVYRAHFIERGLPGGGGTAFMPLVYTADSEEEAEKGAQELTWYMKAKTEPQFRNPPGYVPVSFNVKALQGAYSGRTDAMRSLKLEDQREKGVIMYGTPDSVVEQVKRFYDRVGGFDHLLMMQQAGFLDHQRTVRSMTLFAKEVYPRIKDLPRTAPKKAMAAAQ